MGLQPAIDHFQQQQLKRYNENNNNERRKNNMGKSAAKIRRNIARAAARGETYTPPESSQDRSMSKIRGGDNATGTSQSEEIADEAIRAKSAAAEKLERALSRLESNPEDLNAKERRSAKRKAEAIAVEESGCDGVAHLMEWYERHKASSSNATGGKKKRSRQSSDQASTALQQLSEEDKTKLESAKKLSASIAELDKDGNLNAKERRSAKRKAEAIAAEETGTAATELLEWYNQLVPPAADKFDSKGKKIPYIVFVGQLSYSTTSDMLYDHFHSTLGSDVISRESVKIRLLTDSKTKKSRGMAFVELESPETMYECLKMHLTHLDGRRINVERSAGGGATAKKAKISSFRESQSNYISETMDHILSGFVKNGEVLPEELDEGVISLCKRHSATVVEAALKEYVQEKKERKAKKESLGEKEEEELRNPSAFLTHMIGRIAEEGVGSTSQ